MLIGGYYRKAALDQPDPEVHILTADPDMLCDFLGDVGEKGYESEDERTWITLLLDESLLQQ